MSLGRIKDLEDKYNCLCKQLNEIEVGPGGDGIQEGDNISLLTNDEGYITLDDIISSVIITALGYTPVSNSFASDAEVTAGNTVKAVNGSGVKNHVATAIAALLDSAPGTLDTLNELAAALNDDPNFATTITALIGAKLAKDGNLTETVTGLKTFSSLLTASAGLATTNITTTGGDVGTSGSTFLNAFVKRINAIGTLTLISGATSDILLSNSSPTAGVFGILKGATGRLILQSPGAATTTDTTEQLQVNGDAKITTDLSVGDDLTVAGDLILSTITALATKAATVLVNDGGIVKTRTIAQLSEDLIDNTSLRRVAKVEAQGNGSALNASGLLMTATGTVQTRNITYSFSNYPQRVRKVGYLGATSPNANAGLIGAAQFITSWGFTIKFGFNIQTYDAAHRYICGIGETTTNTVNPSTLVNRIGIYANPGDTTWKLHGVDATTPQIIDLGSDFPCNNATTDFFDVIIEVLPGATTATVTVIRNGGAFVTVRTITTMPTNNVLLIPQVFASNVASGTAATINISRVEVITDY